MNMCNGDETWRLYMCLNVRLNALLVSGIEFHDGTQCSQGQAKQTVQRVVINSHRVHGEFQPQF